MGERTADELTKLYNDAWHRARVAAESHKHGETRAEALRAVHEDGAARERARIVDIVGERLTKARRRQVEAADADEAAIFFEHEVALVGLLGALGAEEPAGAGGEGSRGE